MNREFAVLLVAIAMLTTGVAACLACPSEASPSFIDAKTLPFRRPMSNIC
jgi:hypothetical protein